MARVQPTDRALSYLRPELEYRLRYVVQEAWKIARRCRRSVLLRDDIEAAHAILSGSLHSRPWTPLPGLDSDTVGGHEAFGLYESLTSSRADSLFSGADRNSLGVLKPRQQRMGAPSIMVSKRWRLEGLV